MSSPCHLHLKKIFSAVMASTLGKLRGEEKKTVEREQAENYPGVMNTRFTKSAIPSIPSPTSSLGKWPLLLCLSCLKLPYDISCYSPSFLIIPSQIDCKQEL